MAFRIAFFGDSLSVGQGASDPAHGFVGRVLTWLRTRNGNKVVATTRATSGVPVAHWMYAAIPRRLNVAVVELGTNDVRLSTPVSEFGREYSTLIRRIRSANPNVQLLCLSVWPSRHGARQNRAVNAQIRATCRAGYVDIGRFRARVGIRSADGFHPNDAGYELIAQTLEAKLKTR